MAGLTLFGLQRSWDPIDELERRLTTNQFESFRLAEEFQARLHNLNNSMLRFTTSRDPAIWTEFEHASKALDEWIDQNNPESAKRPASSRERGVFLEINKRYDDYILAARQVHDHSKTNTPGVLLSESNQFDKQAEGLVRLALQLADTHREAERAFLNETNRSLAVLRFSLSVGVFMLLFLSGGLALLLYRDLVAPLRIKLVESEMLLARQEKLATLGTLAAGIAHEIRNPLTSIKARLYTLNKHIAGNGPGVGDAEVIRAEISRLDRIVQEVLRFARPSDPKPETARADLLLRDVQTLMAPTFAGSNIELVLEPGPELWVSTDAALIKQVLINLIRNAAEAIADSGKIILRVRHGRAFLQGKMSDAAILEVADTGRGIPPEVEKRLFDPFFTTKETGTGLGLPIAARIVEKHGGVLQYQTKVGRGTTFGIVLRTASGRTSPAAGHPLNAAAEANVSVRAAR